MASKSILSFCTSTGILPTACTPSTAKNTRSEEHTSELQSRSDLVCRLLLEKKKSSFAVLIGSANYSLVAAPLEGSGRSSSLSVGAATEVVIAAVTIYLMMDSARIAGHI